MNSEFRLYVLPHLSVALQAAESTLLARASAQGIQPEIGDLNIHFNDEGPYDHWTLSVTCYIDGPCPYYGLDFQGSKLLDMSGAD